MPKHAWRFFLSAGIALVVMLGISFAIEDPAQAHSTRVTAVIVTAVIAAMPIYSVERWSLGRRTLVHALAMLVVVVPCLMLSGWFAWWTLPGALALVGTYLAFGAAGWLVGFTVNRVLERRAARAAA